MNAIADPKTFDVEPISSTEFSGKIEAAGLLIRAAEKLRTAGELIQALERRAEALSRGIAGNDHVGWTSTTGGAAFDGIAIHLGSIEDAIIDIDSHLEFLETREP